MEVEYPPSNASAQDASSPSATSTSHRGSPSLIPPPSDSRTNSNEATAGTDGSKSAQYNNSPPAAGAAADTAPSDPLADLKRPRACEACRQLKVRCDPDQDHPDGSCKRCVKANRRCIVTVPTRKRQKKADSRVAELERKIDALTATLQASRAKSYPSDLNDSGPQQHVERSWSGSSRWSSQRRVSSGENPSSSAGLAGSKRSSNGDIRSLPGMRPPAILPPSKSPSSHTTFVSTWLHGESPNKQESSWPVFLPESSAGRRPDHEYADVIDRGIIDQETAAKAFTHYVKVMAPLMPAVVFSPGTKMGDVRRETPILFLSVLSVSIASCAPSLEPILTSEMHKIFADRIVVRGEKSLELMQALVIASLWYMPPEHYEELKFYLLIHLAAIMGTDMGMNRRSKPQAQSSEIIKELMSRKAIFVDPQSLDVKLLLESPDAYPSDRALVEWVKLAHIGEEIGFQFSMDDPLTNISIDEPRVQFALKGFETRLDEWRKEVPSKVYSPVMEHYEQVLSIYMHEIGMHIDHNIDDFKPPFLPGLAEESQANLGTAAHVNALTACLTSIHRVLDLFGTMDRSLMSCLPTIHFVRTSYACVALIKLYSVASSPGSRLANVFSTADFKVEASLNNLINHLHTCNEGNQSRVGLRFSLIIGMLKAWYAKRKDKKAEVPLPPFLQPRASKSEKTAPAATDTGADDDANKSAPLRNSSTSNTLGEAAVQYPSSTATTKQGVQQSPNKAAQNNISQPCGTNTPGQAIVTSPGEITTTSAATIRTYGPSGLSQTASSSGDWPPFVSQNQMSTNPYTTTAPCESSMQQQYMNPTFGQNENFVSQAGFNNVPTTGMDQQILNWGHGTIPGADLSAVMTFRPSLWDEELFQLSLEGFEGVF
ncbi:C6 transcription factor (War1), putative [Trichophyton verrucosum HKI 0517]|uniref:C6 transcription factor (War1), putative n=1 Tax=Trichophyton verrucosum (strain HKI 0517) TaxID=663202 RepID=D4DLG0_TRIVH|nr:C6 transcription factor (War1), putative [Trichophyton verrucosum HKI 0517]EFE37312.1 C6 transcription factor (War1), putative [Trichophyton verrucosum HKI 0517]